jgi:6-phosphogluconate dehydrogenase
MSSEWKAKIGVFGLAVMGQNLALNIAEHGFNTAVHNRDPKKVETTVERAKAEKVADRLRGFTTLESFVASLERPRTVLIMIQAGSPVDQAIAALSKIMEPGDLIIDGGNEWYLNTERRGKECEAKGLLYMGMGVSGGEEGARHGPALMPGGPLAAYKIIEPIVTKIAAQVRSSGPCVCYIGLGGSGNYVKMIHNGIEYGDMQLIAEAYDIMKTVGKLTNDELQKVFSDWNKSELESYLIEITAQIFKHKEADNKTHTVDMILDKTGSKGTGKWTVQEAAEQAIACPTITSALDARYLSSLLDERKHAATILTGPSGSAEKVEKEKIVEDVRLALYAAKICSYAQGMNLIRAAGLAKGWNLNLGEIARIWKGGCIIRAIFLDRIKSAYDRNANLANLLIDPDFAREINTRQGALRRVVTGAINAGIAVPSLSSSLAYFDAYRRARLPANLTQAQRDFFGAHGYERTDRPLVRPGVGYHTEWSQA